MMEVTALTWVVAVAGLAIMLLLGGLQLVAVLRPRSQWTIDNVYGGSPESTDPRAYFAFHQGYAWADAVFWAPLQIAASIGMLLGHRWGFLLALVSSVPFWYTAIPIFIWDRDLGFRENTVMYWVVIWGMFPAYGVFAGIYCFVRLLD
jgi:formate-dependent nitrite reductase membrane component NrfD